MHSAWFWRTELWRQYQAAYHHGQIPSEYKASPLDPNGEDFNWDVERKHYSMRINQTRVLDLTPPMETLWKGVRDSYRALINKGIRGYDVEISDDVEGYRALHAEANNGQPRPTRTYEMQGEWLTTRNGLLVMADQIQPRKYVAAAYWIIYEHGAYYASGPSVEKNIQHAVIWKSLELLKAMGVTKVELGQVDGETAKERNIGTFKKGFGGTAVSFTTVTKRGEMH